MLQYVMLCKTYKIMNILHFSYCVNE